MNIAFDQLAARSVAALLRSIALLPGTAASPPQIPARARRHVAMTKAAILTVERPLGASVSCLRGSLWITHDGEPKDIVLEAGASYESDRATRMLVYALEDSAALVL
jgi:hypothetical protein